MKLPAKKEFKVAYRIKAAKGISGKFFINGEFSFTEQDGEANNCVLTQKEIPLIPSADKTADITAKQEPKATEQKSGSYKIADNTQKQQPKAEAIKTPTAKAGNIYFSVQIAAVPKLLGPDHFKKRYQITEEVYLEMHNGLNKYSLGRFDEYAVAKKYREKIIRSHNIETNPFVIAYHNGQRIPIQEALRILARNGQN
jgi:hypothetical protein